MPVVKSHEVGRTTFGTAYLDDLAMPIRRFHRHATYENPLAYRCVHYLSPPFGRNHTPLGGARLGEVGSELGRIQSQKKAVHPPAGIRCETRHA